MKISVFGLGYVGTVSAGCLAEMGHGVIGVDVQETKVQAIREGRCLLIEPELPELIAAAVKQGRLSATTDARQAVDGTEISLICVGTPSKRSGAIQLDHIEAVCRQIGQALAHKSGHVIAVRSTLLPGAVQNRIIPILEESSGKKAGRDFAVCTNPEFLREGTAVADFRKPPMQVIGESSPKDGEMLIRCYGSLDCETFRCSPDEAMMVKYACNAFHAAKVTFANEIGAICNILNLDSHRVMEIFTQDRELNISPRYLKPGFAFGGSCLPKDVRAVVALTKENHLSVPLLESLLPSNGTQMDRALDLILGLERKKIGVLGLSFKDKTDDLRESPVVEVVERLLGKGREICIHDKDVRLTQLFGRNLSEIESRLPHVASLLRDNVEEVVAHGEIILVAKGSKIYRELLPPLLKPGQMVVDLVRLFKAGEIRAEQYFGVCG